jgi:quinol monooxygenase YgiN
MPTIEIPSATIANSLHVIVWEFEIRPDAMDAFVKAYGPKGDWARLFSQSPEFLRLELVQSVQHSNRFFTFDHWASSEAFEAFHESNERAYEALDRKLSGLTAWERRIGAFPVEEELI